MVAIIAYNYISYGGMKVCILFVEQIRAEYHRWDILVSGIDIELPYLCL